MASARSALAAQEGGLSLGRRFTAWFRLSDVALVPLVYGLALQLRAWLTWRPLWLDEQMIARNIRDRDLAGLATVLDYNQAAPIGWLWTQRVVVEVAGTGERALRFVPFLFAAGSLVLAWLAVRRMLGPVGSFTAVTLFAVNDYLLRYATEVKQYSGDVFWVLLMIVLAWWALAAPTPRRFVIWWSAAALASLFSMGGILAMPGLALVLAGTAWWRGRWRLAWWASLPGIIWLAAFVPHYLLTMGPLRDNDAMTRFWARRGYPPATADQGATVEWAVRRLEVLAGHPLGLDAASLGREWLLFAAIVFWSLAVLGMLVAVRGGVPTGLLFAAPVISAFALALLWVSPLYMRLAMWIMPALFLAVGFAVDAAARLVARGGWGRARWSRWAGGLVGMATMVTAAVAFAPLQVAAVRPPAPSLFDYRGAVRWLVAQHRPGDITVGVNGGRHALGWYDPGGRLSPVTWVTAPEGKPCDPDGLRQRLAGFRRVLLYADLRDQPSIRGADALNTLLDSLGGDVVANGSFGPRGRVSIVELPVDVVELPADQDSAGVPDGADHDSESSESPQPCLRIII